jgi:hypothetical protein
LQLPQPLIGERRHLERGLELLGGLIVARLSLPLSGSART